MLSNQEVNAALGLVGVGVVLLCIALVRPRWLRYIPGNTWFSGVYRAGRFGSMVGAGCFIGAGIRDLMIIPKSWWGVIVFVWSLVVIWAAIHDFMHRAEIEAD